jgi:hypothetical protein
MTGITTTKVTLTGGWDTITTPALWLLLALSCDNGSAFQVRFGASGEGLPLPAGATYNSTRLDSCSNSVQVKGTSGHVVSAEIHS